MESTFTRKTAIATAALSLTLASATASFAGDCNWKKKQDAKAATYQTVAADQTSVMGATVHKAGYDSSKTYAKNETVVDAAMATDSLSTLVAAVKAADLVDTLSSDGPFTVFAPTNAAFEALPAGTVDSLLMPENKDTLTSILTYHVVSGNLASTDIVALAEANGGKTSVTTVSGDTLTAKLWDGKLYLKDESGNKFSVTTADVKKSNGTVHIIDGVLMPKMDKHSS